ncbi:tellurite resistance TerB family protein [Roseinatronobacter sp. NSM]|uniref:tellurite resistance TerB family protein n=1 Tax=Roseinatronobacter sp. NSM TaxID=3457785 RepID=UPI0040363BA3
MFDARQLLDQVMGGLSSYPRAGGALKNVQAASSGGTGQLLTGALAGGVLGMLAGNKRARKFAGKSAGTALKLGGLAAVAAIGYTAWQRSRGAPDTSLQLPPAESGFAPEQAPNGQDMLARGVLVAMIQGAKADGHIDAAEHARIFQQLEALSLDAQAKAFVMDELAAPQDINRVTAYANSPEVAAELYAAALLAMDPDTPQERQFLTRLQTALGLDAALADHLEAAVKAQVQG